MCSALVRDPAKLFRYFPLFHPSLQSKKIQKMVKIRHHYDVSHSSNKPRSLDISYKYDICPTWTSLVSLLLDKTLRPLIYCKYLFGYLSLLLVFFLFEHDCCHGRDRRSINSICRMCLHFFAVYVEQSVTGMNDSTQYFIV